MRFFKSIFSLLAPHNFDPNRASIVVTNADKNQARNHTQLCKFVVAVTVLFILYLM